MPFVLGWSLGAGSFGVSFGVRAFRPFQLSSLSRNADI